MRSIISLGLRGFRVLRSGQCHGPVQKPCNVADYAVGLDPGRTIDCDIQHFLDFGILRDCWAPNARRDFDQSSCSYRDFQVGPRLDFIRQTSM